MPVEYFEFGRDDHFNWSSSVKEHDGIERA